MRRRLRDIDTEEEMIEAFKVFDRDSNGLISFAELKFVMTRIGEQVTNEDIQEIIDAGDADNDGCLNYEEFVKMMIDK